MRIIYLLLTHVSLAVQVVSPIAGLFATAQAPAHAEARTPVPYTINLDASKPQPVVAATQPKADIEAEVLAPLRAKQAADAQAALEAARAAGIRAQAAKQPATVGDDAFYQIRLCESGGDYTRNSGNGYFGAYQYALGSWGGYGGYDRPDLAPAAVQDAKAHADQAARGWSPWANCARRAGLM